MISTDPTAGFHIDQSMDQFIINVLVAGQQDSSSVQQLL